MREDYRSASIRQMIFNMAVDAKSRLPLDQFLLKWETEEKKPVNPKKKAEQQWKMLELLAIAHSVPAKDK